uniref:Uncharacterized protein n=1 Tax=Arundo donax TaxID=35708 RepID=A0A0A9TIK8_ARUDO
MVLHTRSISFLQHPINKDGPILLSEGLLFGISPEFDVNSSVQ